MVGNPGVGSSEYICHNIIFQPVCYFKVLGVLDCYFKVVGVLDWYTFTYLIFESLFSFDSIILIFP